ncbi:hypothetical protein FB451DRAFT_1168840 [Mycena latifolia]|nr:hypothetical protein FB451DRAFT_1168840 [Mycena latifolia]
MLASVLYTVAGQSLDIYCYSERYFVWQLVGNFALGWVQIIHNITRFPDMELMFRKIQNLAQLVFREQSNLVLRRQVIFHPSMDLISDTGLVVLRTFDMTFGFKIGFVCRRLTCVQFVSISPPSSKPDLLKQNLGLACEIQNNEASDFSPKHGPDSLTWELGYSAKPQFPETVFVCRITSLGDSRMIWHVRPSSVEILFTECLPRGAVRVVSFKTVLTNHLDLQNRLQRRFRRRFCKGFGAGSPVSQIYLKS